MCLFVFGLFTTQLPWRQRLQTRAVCKRLYTCLFTRKEGGRPDHLAGGRAPSTVALHGALHSLKELLAALAIGGRPGVCAWRRDEVDHVLVARALRGCGQIGRARLFVLCPDCLEESINVGLQACLQTRCVYIPFVYLFVCVCR